MQLEDQIQTLKQLVRGPVLEPQDAGYEQARKVYNGMIDKRPRLIVHCTEVADVIACVHFARETGIVTAIRGGGHNGAGLGTCDDGVVIDMSRMHGIRVDPVAQTVRAEAGCRQGDVDHAAHAFGLAVPAGVISTTGIAGLTLGGGHGYLTRKYGLTIDNLLEADLVLADGRFVTASAARNEDLYWAIRGGGGNFGVVTSFLYRAQPVHTVFAGVTLWPIQQAGEVAEWFREVVRTASEDTYCFLAFLVVPPGPPFPEPLHNKTMISIVWCHCGPLENAGAAFQPLRRFRKPAFEHLGPMPFPALQSLFDPLLPPGLQWYWKGDFFTELSDAAIAEHLKFGANLPSPLSLMHLYPIDGALNRVAPGDTAFSYRHAKYSMVIAGVDPDPANASRITKWAKDYWAALHPYSAGGAYVNFMMEEGVERVKATYRGNFDRLATVKAQYDPSNLFRVNQNIRPADATGRSDFPLRGSQPLDELPSRAVVPVE